jgi:acetyl-CoA carboxylase carboxyl transferase subunit alpha
MANGIVYDFEKPIVELEKKIVEMRELSRGGAVELSREIESLERKLDKLTREIYSGLSRWQRVQLARHPKRPYTLDYVERICDDFIELHGDRGFADDKAVVGGPAKFSGHKVIVIGQQKARDTKSKLYRNFGMMHPEGYRKAMRFMWMGQKFGMPILVFIDTPGAYPGIGAEERGQAEAIAFNIKEMSRLTVPIVISIIGEGASGGALGIGVGDAILMMENSWYSVISPEGCAAILWRDAAMAPQAAEALRPTAPDLMELDIIDEVVPEPPGGAHRDYDGAAANLSEAIGKNLEALLLLSTDDLLQRRLQKFRNMGVFYHE